MKHTLISWAIGLEDSLVDTSILALVYLGISLMKLYRAPSFNGMSCQGEMVLSPSLKTTRKSTVPASPVDELVTAARAMTLIANKKWKECQKTCLHMKVKSKVRQPKINKFSGTSTEMSWRNECTVK